MKMMKKLIAVCAAAMMLTVPVCAAEAADYTGVWYTDFNGAVLKMTINDDGTYVMEFGGDPQEGTWEQTEEGIMLDGEAAGVITEEGLEVSDENMAYVFGRDEIEAFVPAEIDYEASLDLLQGEWSAYKVGTDGVYMDVAPGDTYYMEMDITDTTAVMNGFYFENIALELDNQDGGLSKYFQDESEMFKIIAINYLEDGTLRLALVASTEDNDGIEYFFIPAEAAENQTEAATD